MAGHVLADSPNASSTGTGCLQPRHIPGRSFKPLGPEGGASLLEPAVLDTQQQGFH